MNTEKPELTEIIKEIISNVESNIIGRVANKIGDVKYNSLEILLKYVALAGNGNHIEIGTLFGGSAIPVALLKERLGLSGIVLCIDPLNGYYSQYAPRVDMVDTQSGYPVTPTTLFDNINKFNVQGRIAVMACNSNWISNIEDMQFVTAYIDGDHRGTQPMKDFFMVADKTTKYILFDNYDDYHSDVMDACHRVSKLWKFKELSGITYVVEKE